MSFTVCTSMAPPLVRTVAQRRCHAGADAIIARVDGIVHRDVAIFVSSQRRKGRMLQPEDPMNGQPLTLADDAGEEFASYRGDSDAGALLEVCHHDELPVAPKYRNTTFWHRIESVPARASCVHTSRVWLLECGAVMHDGVLCWEAVSCTQGKR